MSLTPSRMFASSSTIRIFSFTLASSRYGQVKLKSGAHAHLALHVDAPLVAVDDLAHDGQSQGGAARLRGEERRENLIKNVGRDARAGFADGVLAPARLGHPRFAGDLPPFGGGITSMPL